MIRQCFDPERQPGLHYARAGEQLRTRLLLRINMLWILAQRLHIIPWHAGATCKLARLKGILHAGG